MIDETCRVETVRREPDTRQEITQASSRLESEERKISVKDIYYAKEIIEQSHYCPVKVD